VKVSLNGSAGNLEGWLARPERVPLNGRPGVVIVPGFPADTGGGANSFRTFPDLADRVADHARMVAIAVAFRGLAGSTGHFSLDGWRQDLGTAIDYIRSDDDVDGSIWLMGFGTGGALAIAAAAADGHIAGLVSVAAPADFQDWASRPRELLSHARKCGAISDPNFPPEFGRWAKELQGVSAVENARRLDEMGTLLMVLHGGNDDAVPPLDAREIADAHGAAELRLIEGARHHLRHDPRAMATAIGFLDRRGRPATDGVANPD
jgi:alpha/beta superfamily hydrolase